MCKILSYLFVLKTGPEADYKEEDNHMTSMKWVERIVAIGLSLMPPEAQKERMSRVFISDGTINGPALAELIAECKVSAEAFLEAHKSSKAINEEQRNMIRELLDDTDGKRTVASMTTEDDAKWLLELRDKIFSSGLTIEDLKEL